MKSVINRVEKLEDKLLNKEEGWDLMREGVLCIINGVPIPMPAEISTYSKLTLEQRLENLDLVERNLEQRKNPERDMKELEELRGKLLRKTESQKGII